jgi:hypothetical protein
MLQKKEQAMICSSSFCNGLQECYKKEQAMPYAHLLFVMVCKNVTKKEQAMTMLIFFL